MSKIEEVKAKLEARLVALAKRMNAIDDRLDAPSDDDFEEMASESADDESLERVGHASGKEVGEINQALELIKRGDYGKCVACGATIAAGRLEAIPHATRCIKCAQP